jgi:NADPH:quinone reductase-like Zn-dependent oxidoreductase
MPVPMGEEHHVKETLRVTGGTGADVLFDAIGGPELPARAAALKEGGAIVVYGWLDQRPIAFPMNWPQTIHT